MALVAGLAVGACSGGSSDDRSAAPAEPTVERVRIVSQNILHGISCAPESERCELPARVALFAQQLDEAGCPDIVAMQETNEEVIAQLRPELAKICSQRYEIVTDGDQSLDREIVLTTGKVVDSRRVRLAGPLRTAFHARIATDVGLVEVVNTHLASDSDDRPCDSATCPPPCLASDSLNTCQARRVIELADEVSGDESVTVIVGDLNARPDEPTNDLIRDAGYTDAHIAAGNDECVPATGDQCTAGRADADLSDLRNPDSRQTERIDFVYVGGGRQCSVVEPSGLFNALAAVDSPSGIAFPSDHTGVQAALSCPTTKAHLEAAASASSTTIQPTTTLAGGEVDAATALAITNAFTTLFGGEVTDVEEKLASLERGEELREAFLEAYEATRETASRITVRIDEIVALGPTDASVTYSLLLDGVPVLDHLPGVAVLVGERWLVSTRTYCEVSTQGATGIPAACTAND